jgi:hypothetical protein
VARGAWPARATGIKDGMPLPRPLVLRTLYVVLTVLCAAGLVAAAVLAPAPAAALPAVVALAIGLPMIGAWELSRLIAELQRAALGGRAIAMLRRELDALPETRHPLGL